jgi:ABC-type nickel/cobalt efflux system permease component RcnA
MLFLMLLLVLIIPFLVIGLLANLSPTTLFAVLIVLVAVWIINRGYRDWKRKKEEQTEDAKPTLLQIEAEPATVDTSEPAEIKCTLCGKMHDSKEEVCPHCGAKNSPEEQTNDTPTQP